MLRPHVTSAAMAATGIAADGPLFLMDYLLRFLRVAVLLAIWRMILATRGSVSGMSAAAILTYTLVAEAFAQPLACRTDLDEGLWNGSIAMRFLRPLGLPAQMASESVGGWCFSLVAFSLPLLLVAPLLGVDPRPASLVAGALFLVSLALGIGVGMALEFAFAGLMVSWGLSPWDLQRIRSALETLLSGALLPLAVLPWGLGRWLQWLPFASKAAAPLQIYTGTGAPGPLLAAQVAWCVALWLLASAMWRSGREKLVCYGG